METIRPIQQLIEKETGKKVSEHALSMATEKDCKLTIDVKNICKDDNFFEADQEAMTGFAITPQIGYKMGKLDLNVSYSSSSVGDTRDKQPYNYLAIKAMFKIF